ncbi:hypothetical protein [Paraburkholderia sp.]|uniref:hypothetical protein n=1 Tax=Paraburkholderia sp. TaxID=1926495 RepID=UPI002AFE48A9|nr:hypothetical protein [Paraburkholderia sp.]
MKKMTAGLLAFVFLFTYTTAIAERPDSLESLQNAWRRVRRIIMGGRRMSGAWSLGR